MSDVDGAKTKVAGAVDRLADELEALSHRIHDHPELCSQRRLPTGNSGARIACGVIVKP